MSAMQRAAPRARRDAGARVVAPDYVHHVPGRLRFKADALKRDAAHLDAVCAGLAGLRGVGSARTNAFTGSITVEYDAMVLPPAALCMALQQHGFIMSQCQNAVRPTSFPERLAAHLLEAPLERLALALIAAI